MGIPFFRLENRAEFLNSTYDGMIRILPVKGFTSLFFPKWILETMVYALVSAEHIHVSGATGTGKSALIEALFKNTDNFTLLTEYLGYETGSRKPVLHQVPVCMLESPGDVLYRRAIVENANGATITVDEKSHLIKELEAASRDAENAFHFIWLIELGRVLNENVQGAMVLVLNKSGVFLPLEKKWIDTSKVGIIADSNYSDDQNNYSLVNFDEAVKRRLTTNVVLTHFGVEENQTIMAELCRESGFHKIKPDLVEKAVLLAHKIRLDKAAGKLSSLSIPTISCLLSFFKMADAMPVMNPRICAFSTLLGNASASDLPLAVAEYNSVFGNIRGAGEKASQLENC